MADQATSKRSPALPSATVPVKACLYMRAKCFQAAVGFLSRILTVGQTGAQYYYCFQPIKENQAVDVGCLIAESLFQLHWRDNGGRCFGNDCILSRHDALRCSGDDMVAGEQGKGCHHGEEKAKLYQTALEEQTAEQFA